MNLDKIRLNSKVISLKKYLRPLGYRRAYVITFWLTHHCVYSCKYCLLESNSGPFLPKETVFKITKESLPLRLNMVDITGGECMLHPDFEEIVNFTAKHTKLVGIHTTGRLLNKDILKRITDGNKNLFWYLTIMSSDREINDRYRAKGALDDVIGSAKLLGEFNQKLKVHINLVPEGLRRLEETIQFAFEELNATAVTTEPVSPMGRAAKNAKEVILSDLQLYQSYVTLTNQIAKWKNKGKTLAPCNVLEGYPQKCISLEAFVGFNVHPAGNMNPCCYFTNADCSIGNVEDGVRKVGSLSRLLKLEKLMAPTHCNVEERVNKVGIWSCYECVCNFQTHVKGMTEYRK